MKKTNLMSLVIIAMIAIATVAISIPQASAATTGFASPSQTLVGNTPGWVNPTAAFVDDPNGNVLATYTYTAVPQAQQKYHGYGFAIPDATISSVIVEVDAGRSFTEANTMTLMISIDGGATFFSGSNPNVFNAGTASNIIPYYIDITSWTNWDPSKLNNDQIWVAVTKGDIYTGNTAKLDWVAIQITYEPSSVVPEYALGGLGALAVTFAALVVFMKRSSIPGFKRQ